MKITTIAARATVLLLGAGVAAVVGVRSREKVELVDLHFNSKSHLPTLFGTYL